MTNILPFPISNKSEVDPTTPLGPPNKSYCIERVLRAAVVSALLFDDSEGCAKLLALAQQALLERKAWLTIPDDERRGLPAHLDSNRPDYPSECVTLSAIIYG